MITRKKIRYREETSKNESVKSSDTSTDVSNRIFTMGDSTVKQVKGYELSRKLQSFC